MARLLVRDSGDSEGEIREVELQQGEMSIGRGEKADLVLDNQTVSRSHAMVTRTSQGYVLKDLGSSNGTWVNGSRTSERLLRHEDRIRFGKAVAIFDEPPDPGATVLVDVKELLDEIQGTAKIDVEQHRAPELPMPRLDEPPPPSSAPAPGTAQPEPITPPPKPAPRPAPPPLRPEPRRAPPPVQPSSPAPPAKMSSARSGGGQPAGFWIRVLAYLIDVAILACIGGGLSVVAAVAVRMLSNQISGLQIWLVPIVWAISAVLPMLYLLIGWTRSGRTVGKAVCRLRVTCLDGSEVGFGTAVVRLIGYFLSSLILCIGYLMVAFTDRKRGLHDMVAGTVVVKER